MTKYAVRLYDGPTNAHDDHTWVEAATPQEAAEAVYGGPVSCRGGINDMCATVRVRTSKNTWTDKVFYRVLNSN